MRQFSAGCIHEGTFATTVVSNNSSVNHWCFNVASSLLLLQLAGCAVETGPRVQLTSCSF